MEILFFSLRSAILTPAVKVLLIVHFTFTKMSERGEAKSAKRSFASKMKIRNIGQFARAG
jgi:hypothetical protein